MFNFDSLSSFNAMLFDLAISVVLVGFIGICVLFLGLLVIGLFCWFNDEVIQPALSDIANKKYKRFQAKKIYEQALKEAGEL